jgi:hypothetical protein
MHASCAGGSRRRAPSSGCDARHVARPRAGGDAFVLPEPLAFVELVSIPVGEPVRIPVVKPVPVCLGIGRRARFRVARRVHDRVTHSECLDQSDRVVIGIAEPVVERERVAEPESVSDAVAQRRAAREHARVVLDRACAVDECVVAIGRGRGAGAVGGR